jgi:hypothetical protein
MILIIQVPNLAGKIARVIERLFNWRCIGPAPCSETNSWLFLIDMQLTARRSLDAAFIGFALAAVVVVGDLVEFFHLKRENTISAKRLAHIMGLLCYIVV